MGINAGDILKTTMVCQQQGVKWSNSFHWLSIDDIGDGDESAELASLSASIADAFAQVMHEQTQVLGIVWSTENRPQFGSRTVITNEPGALSGDLSQTTQYFIIRRYAQNNSPSGRGRTLVAGFPEQWSENNRLTASAVVIAGSLVTFLKAPLNGPIGSYAPLIWSPKLSTSYSTFKTNLDPVVRSLHSRQATLI